MIVKVKLLSGVRLFATPWTIAYQAPLSMGFLRQEYWSGLPFPSPGDLPNPGIEPRSSTFQADTLTSEPPGKPSRHATRQIPLLSSPQASAIIWYWEEEHVQLQANGYWGPSEHCAQGKQERIWHFLIRTKFPGNMPSYKHRPYLLILEVPLHGICKGYVWAKEEIRDRTHPKLVTATGKR